MLGTAWQAGLVPVSLAALERAIELNGVEVAKNRQAFAAGPLAAAIRKVLPKLGAAEDGRPETLEQVIERRASFLVDYQDAAWAERYRDTIERVRAAEKRFRRRSADRCRGPCLFKLMSYKDEYEVARLHM